MAVFDPSGEAPVDPARWHAVDEALQSRVRGEVRQVEAPGFRCAWTGEPAGGAHPTGGMCLTDGWPDLPHPAAGEGSPRSAEGGGLIEAWRHFRGGLPARLEGDFALFGYDPVEHRLTLARDQFGTRPLHWLAWRGAVFAASEVKALAALGAPLGIDEGALREVLVCRWLTGQHHLLAPVRTVPPGGVVHLTPGRQPLHGFHREWSLDPGPGDAGDLPRFRNATRAALQASLAPLAGRGPVGILLSGGVDSSILAAVAREVVGDCVAFVGRMPYGPDPELPRARAVARHLRIPLREVDVRQPSLEAELAELVRRLEEPPRHPNNFVLDQLFRRAAQEVGTVLHGDGAEMLFGLADVRRVEKFRTKRRLVKVLPAQLREYLAPVARKMPSSRGERLARVLRWQTRDYAALLDMISYSPKVWEVLRQAVGDGRTDFLPAAGLQGNGRFSDALQLFQARTFLRASLHRHDRLATPLGLRVGSPFLHPAVVRVASELPVVLRTLGGPKAVLRALCDVYLPPEVSRWSKLGFPVPWDRWVADEIPYLVRAAVPAEGVLPPGFLRAAVEEGDAEGLWTAATLGLLMSQFEP
jgi:asparagine synthase (glutamine-hydrolysing)